MLNIAENARGEANRSSASHKASEEKKERERGHEDKGEFPRKKQLSLIPPAPLYLRFVFIIVLWNYLTFISYILAINTENGKQTIEGKHSQKRTETQKRPNKKKRKC